MTTTTGGRIAVLIAAMAVVLAVSVAPAGAHDPIFVTEDQTTPETGPYLPDGTISFAIYGTLLTPEDTRGLEFDLRDGDDLYVQLLIPDLEPEIGLADSELPLLELSTPSGEVRRVEADTRERFADPFSGTDYVILHEMLETAVAGGRYQILVTGPTPSRFVVAVGQSEQFFTPTERTGDKPGSFEEIAEPLGAWYSTPATGEATVAAEESGVEVDVELIEEELDALTEAEEDTAAEELTDPSAAMETKAPEGTPAQSPPEPADETDESSDDVTEAAAPGDDDADGSGGGLGWVAPVVIIVAIGGGAALYAQRRRAG